MKIDGDRFVNISATSNFYGKEVCNTLLAFHSLTGCDTISYPYGCSKVKPYKKMIGQRQCYLIETFGHELGGDTETFENAMKFFQTIVYNGTASDIV